jgi:hypothetical protein
MRDSWSLLVASGGAYNARDPPGPRVPHPHATTIHHLVTPEPEAATAALRALEAQLDAARVAGDVAAFEEVLAQEFRTVGPSGLVAVRDQMLADARSGSLRVRSSRSTDLVIRVSGSTAVVNGRARLEASYQGRDISGVFAYTHVYRWSDGRWQVITAHSSAELPNWVMFLALKLRRWFARGSG